jgi:hypothetical protein
MEILDDEHQRPPPRENLEEATERSEERPAHRVGLCGTNRAGDARSGRLRVLVAGEEIRHIACAGGANRRHDELAQRPERDALAVGQTAAGQDGRLLSDARGQLVR